jgi:hypothetical protein
MNAQEDYKKIIQSANADLQEYPDEKIIDQLLCYLNKTYLYPTVFDNSKTFIVTQDGVEEKNCNYVINNEFAEEDLAQYVVWYNFLMVRVIYRRLSFPECFKITDYGNQPEWVTPRNKEILLEAFRRTFKNTSIQVDCNKDITEFYLTSVYSVKKQE